MLFDELIATFEGGGFTVRTSISPFMLTTISAAPAEDGTLTHLGRPGADWMGEPGDLSLTDLCFVEALGRARPARRILVLGGRSGWNALAVSFANPDAGLAVLADPAGTAGAGFPTIEAAARRRKICALARLGPVSALDGFCDEALGGVPDLVFVDANPPGGAFEAAFAAAYAKAGPTALYLFGGLIAAGAVDRFVALAAGFPDRFAAVLSRTASGIGVLAPAGGDAALARVANGFCDPFATIPA
ncbi:MAG: hypothetical protein ING19_19890 [Azospirillum sp.]|nr:hypothetical protein [Azospirillum sp.]MCA3268329.1 hypothetical protein [Azospirillum sp.]MCZ8124188.1 hypothetical protein [Magnetospirillum sp.]